MDMRILYSVEAEQSVLGGLLLDNQAWDRIADILTANEFYLEKHKIIFNVLVHLFTNNQPADWVTLSNQLKKIKEFENIGGDNYIVDLLKNTPTAANIKTYAEIVKKYSDQRRLKGAAHEIIGMVENNDEGMMDKAGKLILSLSENRATEPKLPDEYITQAFSETIDGYHGEEQSILLKTGFTKLDEIIVGLERSALIILAARPSMGKTLLAINIAENIAIQEKKSVLIFSLEMTATSIGKRLLFKMANVPAWKSKKPKNLTQDEIQQLGNAAHIIKHHKIDIDDKSGLTVMDIRAKARRTKNKRGLDLIVIDYIQLIKATEGENETAKLGYISSGLKDIAKELNVPLLVLSQLNRNIESRANRRPMMSDLRQSGALEQDADVIMFIDRPERYDETAPKGLAKIYVEKNRDGSTGEAELLFRGDWGRFENYPTAIPAYVSDKSAIKKSNYKSFYEDESIN